MKILFNYIIKLFCVEHHWRPCIQKCPYGRLHHKNLSLSQCITGQFWKTEVAVLSDQVRLVACRNFDIFGWLSVIYSLKVDQPKQKKIKKIMQRYVIYISDLITVPYSNIETENRRLNIDEWYVFARRKGLKIYFFFTKVWS